VTAAVRHRSGDSFSFEELPPQEVRGIDGRVSVFAVCHENLIMTSLAEVVSYTNDFLRIREIGDWTTRLMVCRSKTPETLVKLERALTPRRESWATASKQNVDLLIVHHGLFWPGLRPVTGVLRRQLELAFENNIAFTGPLSALQFAIVHPQRQRNAQPSLHQLASSKNGDSKKSECCSELRVIAELRMEIERQMCAVKRDVVFKREFQLPTQHSSHRSQTWPKETVMHDQEIDILF